MNHFLVVGVIIFHIFLLPPDKYSCYQINCHDVVLEDTDVARGIVQYVTETAIEILIIGAGSKGGFFRYVFLKSQVS